MNHIGVDIIEIGRIRQAIARWGDRFLCRVYTEPELELCRRSFSALAVRFASKEAVMKLLGTGRKGVDWREVETLSYPSGEPLVNLYGRARVRAEKLGLRGVAVSLSHSRDYAIAFVAGEK
jgi:holo-[acyl-carrier protein] synthase